jgi:hypothetical protein
VSRKAAVWAGGSLGLAFLTGVELLDGTSAAWGFSWWDMTANVAGTGIFIGQELLWQEQRVRVKLSAHHTAYATQRPDLLGDGSIERYLKDYNGQTIWLSGNLDRFLPDRGFPQWLNLAVGYGATGMTTAFPVPRIDGSPDPDRYRRFYLSPDIDLTRIPARSKALRTLFFVLNSIKLPAPALEITGRGELRGHWIQF